MSIHDEGIYLEAGALVSTGLPCLADATVTMITIQFRIPIVPAMCPSSSLL